MKISIITATYNSLNSLPTALDSILSQTYDDIEWIVVDGQSTDGTIDYIKANEKLINQWASEPDQGIYDALNKGIAMATGDVIGLLHSDDLFNSEYTIAQIAELFKYSKADGVYGNLRYVSKTNTEKNIRFWRSNYFRPQLLKKGWMPAHPSLFLKKEVYQKHGKFDLKFKIAADYDFILRIFQDPELKFSYHNRVITKMRVGGASNRTLKNIIRKSKEDLLALKKNKFNYPYWVLIRKNLSKLSQFFN